MEIPQLIIGTFQTGSYKELLNIVEAGVECGFTGFETAPSYGTEQKLGKAIKECQKNHGLSREQFYVSDKIDAWQMQKYNGNVLSFVESALHDLKLEYLDLLLIHWPIPEYIERTWESFLKIKEKGLTHNIGICNVRKRHLLEYKRQGIMPEYIQIERHPLRTCSEEVEYCKNNNIEVLTYSPLCRMHPELRNNTKLKELSAKYGKNIGQIILRWHIDSKTRPVFMSQKAGRIKENIKIFDFCLEKEEVELINQLNRDYKIFLESWGCPGF